MATYFSQGRSKIKITVLQISELLQVVTNARSFSFPWVNMLYIPVNSLGSKSLVGDVEGGRELAKSACQSSACLNVHPILPKRSFICKAFFVLSGYGDKEVYTKLNPELEKRLPREYTEWRRYS